VKERAKERAVSVGQILDGEVQPRYWKVKRAMVYGIDTLNLEEAVLLLKTIVDYRHIQVAGADLEPHTFGNAGGYSDAG
jgi:hypothetical protein